MYFSAALRAAHFATHIATPLLVSERVYFQQFSWSVGRLYIQFICWIVRVCRWFIDSILDERGKNCTEDLVHERSFSSAVDRNYTKCMVKSDP